jgi:type II secretory pathway component PulC
MRKTIVIILIACAVPLYSYNLYLLLRSSSGESRESSAITSFESFDSWIVKVNAVSFSAADRDPFFPYKPKTNVAPVEKPVQAKPPAPKKEVLQPSLKITGIMWSQENPVAMVVLPNGASSVVKQGGIYADIAIKKIERNRIQIGYQGQSFWIVR